MLNNIYFLQISIAFFCFFAILSLIVLFGRDNKNEKNGCKNTIIAVTSISLTLFGIELTLIDDYLAQFNYNLGTICKYEWQSRNGVDVNDLIWDKTKTPPEYIFALDVSKSTKNSKQNVNVNENIDDIIKYVNASGLVGTKYNDFKVSHNKIPYNELLRVRLLYLLLQMKNMEYNNDDIKYSIVYFADQCEMVPFSSNNLDRRISESFDSVLLRKFDGGKTDFVCLLKFINEKCLKKNNDTCSSSFGKKDYIVVFLSDNIHDDGNGKKDGYMLEKTIKDQLNQMNNTESEVKFFLISDNEDVCISNNIKIDKIVNKIIEEDNNINKNNNHSIFKTVDLREVGNSLDYNMVSDFVLPFFYSNKYFEDSLKATLNFKESLNLSFRLDNYSHRNRQVYRLCPQGNSKKYRLSNNSINYPVREKEKINIEIVGYIPSPDNSPDIIIADTSKGVQYSIPVVFYKKCPKSVSWLSVIIIVVLIIGSISDLKCFKCNKNNNKTTNEEEIGYDIDIKFG